jgi:hypothetical protein
MKYESSQVDSQMLYNIGTRMHGKRFLGISGIDVLALPVWKDDELGGHVVGRVLAHPGVDLMKPFRPSSQIKLKNG